MNADAKQKKPSNKSFICSNAEGTLVYMGFVNGQSFASMGDYLIKTFQCHNAILLDNGGTKAMWVKDKYVAGPGRNMMDAFVVVEGKEQKSATPVEQSPQSKLSAPESPEKIRAAKILAIQKLLADTFQNQHYDHQQIEDKLAQLEQACGAHLASLDPNHPHYEQYTLILQALKNYPR